MKVHPLAIAWWKWSQDKENESCFQGKAEGQYLENRLQAAFEAGWKSAEARLTELVEKP